MTPTPNLRPQRMVGETFAKLHAMNAAYGDMLTNAGKFDGSYEAARDRFNDIREGKRA